jgi:hypothetical protein
MGRHFDLHLNLAGRSGGAEERNDWWLTSTTRGCGCDDSSEATSGITPPPNPKLRDRGILPDEYCEDGVLRPGSAGSAEALPGFGVAHLRAMSSCNKIIQQLHPKNTLRTKIYAGTFKRAFHSSLMCRCWSLEEAASCCTIGGSHPMNSCRWLL